MNKRTTLNLRDNRVNTDFLKAKHHQEQKIGKTITNAQFIQNLIEFYVKENNLQEK